MMNPAGMKRNLLSRAWSHVARYGLPSLWHTLLGKLGNLWYDLREGTDTSGVLGLEALSIPSRNKGRGIYYGATKQRAFAEILNQVSPPRDRTFVDVGCGKGKVLLLAMDHGFKRVRGLEFSPELCAVARRNVEVVQQRRGLTSEIEIVEGDATDYSVRPEDSIFFLFHPFDDHVMASFMDNVAASVERHPRPIWLFYSFPIHGSVIEACMPFLRCEHFHIRGIPYAVYTSA